MAVDRRPPRGGASAGIERFRTCRQRVTATPRSATVRRCWSRSSPTSTATGRRSTPVSGRRVRIKGRPLRVPLRLRRATAPIPPDVADTVSGMVEQGVVVLFGNHDELIVKPAREHERARSARAIYWTRGRLYAAQGAFLRDTPLVPPRKVSACSCTRAPIIPGLTSPVGCRPSAAGEHRLPCRRSAAIRGAGPVSYHPGRPASHHLPGARRCVPLMPSSALACGDRRRRPTARRQVPPPATPAPPPAQHAHLCARAEDIDARGAEDRRGRAAARSRARLYRGASWPGASVRVVLRRRRARGRIALSRSSLSWGRQTGA